jgi:hypothetical protein
VQAELLERPCPLSNRFPIKSWNEVVQQGYNHICIFGSRKGEYLLESSVSGCMAYSSASSLACFMLNLVKID